MPKHLSFRHRRWDTRVSLGRPASSSPKGQPHCPYCGARRLYRKEWKERRVWDIGGPVDVVMKRYRCARCHRSFYHYPEGVSPRSPYSNRVWFLAALLWYLGLSVESTALVLRSLTGRNTSAKGVYQNLLKMGLSLHKRLKAKKSSMLKVVHIDQGYVSLRGKSQAFNIVVSQDGKLLDIALMEAEGIEDFKKVLQEVKRRTNPFLVVGDFHPSHQEGAEASGMFFGGCWFHHLRAVHRRMAKTQDPSLRDILGAATLPFPELEDEFFEAATRSPPGKRKELLFHLSDRYGTLTMAKKLGIGPFFITNNPAERAMARTKVRSKLSRGFGSEDGLLAFIMITQAFGQAMEEGNLSPERASTIFS